jgi:hypothetical protein
MNVSVGDEWEGTSERKLVAREKKSGEDYGKESSLHSGVGELFVCSCCGSGL